MKYLASNSTKNLMSHCLLVIHVHILQALVIFLCLPPSVTGEVYSFLVINWFSALIGLSYIILKVFESTFRKRFRPSVSPVCLYHDFQTNSGTSFLSQIFHVSYTSMDSFQRVLQTNWKFFFLISNWFLEILVQNLKNIQKNRNSWILIKMQCVKYQWIRLDKLYKQMKSLFSIFGIIFRISYNFLK